MSAPSSGAYLNLFTNGNFCGNVYPVDLSHYNQFSHYTFGESVPSNMNADAIGMEITEEHRLGLEQTNYVNLQTGNLKSNCRKRRSQYGNDAPMSKRRMEKVSARLENFHISGDPGPSMLDSEDSNSEDPGDDDIEKGDALLILDERLRKYIEQERKVPPVTINNSLSMALVPYVPPISFDNPTMIGRIKEIAAEDAVECASNDNGKSFVTFPDDGCAAESENCSSETNGENSELSSAMNVTEIDTTLLDYGEMEVDCSY
uniref:Uncharacterized protein n=1 Tax=Setaria digitata TaxID=48799 RepID=A0A915PVU8_9BILA